MHPAIETKWSPFTLLNDILRKKDSLEKKVYLSQKNGHSLK